jgi:hypothetical protein
MPMEEKDSHRLRLRSGVGERAKAVCTCVEQRCCTFCVLRRPPHPPSQITACARAFFLALFSRCSIYIHIHMFVFYRWLKQSDITENNKPKKKGGELRR